MNDIYTELLTGDRFAGHRRWLTIALLGLTLLLCLLRFVHLGADFPIEQRKTLARDSVLYTDEGWYAHNAFHHVKYGDWYRPGDMNFAVNLPVQQLAHTVTMRVLGPNIKAVRVTSILSFFGVLLMTWLIVRRFEKPLVASTVVALMAANFFYFAYSRFGIAENTMLFFMLASVYTLTWIQRPGQLYLSVLAGLLFGCALLTKTSAVTMLPLIGIVILWPFRRSLLVGIGSGVIFSAAFIALVLLHYTTFAAAYKQDFTFFQSINVGMNLDLEPMSFTVGLIHMIKWMRQIDKFLYYVLTYSFVPLLFLLQPLRRNPLVLGSVLYTLTYVFVFTLYNNLQPRYWTALSAPLAIILVLTGKELLAAGKTQVLWRLIAVPYIFLLALGALIGIVDITRYLSSPEYTVQEMADSVVEEMEKRMPGEKVLLGHIADFVALHADVMPVNDLYGPVPLEDRIEFYQPRFLITQDAVDAKLHYTREMMKGNPADYMVRYTALKKYFDIEEIAVYDVLNNYKDYRIHLYQLHPIDPEEPQS